jgi:hypothetical protein
VIAALFFEIGTSFRAKFATGGGDPVPPVWKSPGQYEGGEEACAKISTSPAMDFRTPADLQRACGMLASGFDGRHGLSAGEFYVMLVTSDATHLVKTGPSQAHGIYQTAARQRCECFSRDGIEGPQQRAVLD